MAWLERAGWRAIALCLLASGALQAADFSGAGTGAIPDNNAAGIPITFAVSGIVHSVGRVRLKVTATHPYLGDLSLVLRSPGGKATLLMMGRVGMSPSASTTPLAGSSADFTGTYEFADSAPGDLWAAAAATSNTAAVPGGRYRTSTRGVVNTLHGGCSTSLAGAFNGLAGSDANGTWVLTASDLGDADTGSIGGAILSIDDSADLLFGNGFDAPVRGNCRRARFDYTGSGRSSYAVVRNVSGTAGGALGWFVQDNDGTLSGTSSSFFLGHAGDTLLDADYDGDGITDAVVWTGGAQGQFTVRRSTRSGDAPISVPFGTSGDDPTHAGDYDGDGLDDFAVYRNGATAGAASHTLIRLTASGATRDLGTGVAGDFASGGVDLNGDGRADVAIQRPGFGGSGDFDLYDGTTGAVFASVTIGLATDTVSIGNYVGNLSTDITVSHADNGTFSWITRDASTAVIQTPILLGTSATDTCVIGDFDGDGLDDYAVWSPSATTGASKFIIRRSSAPGTPFTVPFGQNGDYPIENARLH